MPQLRYTLDLFFEAVEDRYADFTDLMPEEIFSPWHVRMPELTEKIYDISAMRNAALAWDGQHETGKTKRLRDVTWEW